MSAARERHLGPGLAGPGVFRPLALRLSEMLYRGLLLFFPADFRRDHGRDAAELFRDRCRDALSAGAWTFARFWARNFVDVAGNGLAERSSGATAARRDTAAAPDPSREARTTPAHGVGLASGDGGFSGSRGPHGGFPSRRPGAGIERWLQTLRFSARILAKSPFYATIVVVIFALTIAAVTTVFSAIDGLLLQPLPFPEPDRLAFVGERSANDDGPAHVTSMFILDAVRREAPSIDKLAIYNIWQPTLTGSGEPKRLSGAAVTWNYFDTLGVPPALGRSFNADDGRPGADLTVVISDRLWRARFGADPGVIGRRIQLDDTGYEIVAVMPAGLESPDQYSFSPGFTHEAPDIWRAFQIDYDDPKTIGRPGSNWLRGVARLAPGATFEGAEAEVETLRQRLAGDWSRWAESARITVLPLQAQFTSDVRPVLWVLAGATCLVLLVGSVNVMNLILSRTIDRSHEFAVRIALGAGRGNLLAHALLEALMLGLAGGVVGVGLGWLSTRALFGSVPISIARLDAIAVRPLTVIVALGLTTAAALLAGLVPGLRLLRRDAGGELSLRSRGGAGATALAHSTLAVVQLALALALLVAAGLLTRSFWKLMQVDPGFDATNVYVAQLDLPPSRYETGDADVGPRMLFTTELARKLRGYRDVAAAGFTTSAPQQGYNNFSAGIGIAGREADPDNSIWAFFRGVSPGYFEAVGATLRRGRLLEDQDFKDGVPTAAVINEELERRYFPDESALGASLTVLGQENLEIVGVVSDVQYGWFGDDPVPETYVPWQGRMYTVFLVVKAAAAGADVPGLMKREVQALDPLLPMDVVWRLEDLTAETMAQTRVPMALMGLLAGFAVLLSAMGTYGVISYMVARRTAEIGVRMALGARAGGMMRMVLARVLRIVTVGTIMGLGLAWAGSRFLESLLFGVTAHDPLTFVLVAGFLAVASLLACLQPARRATRVDPIIALRRE